MYFSLITPQAGHELEAARIWNGVYDDHQWLWQFFPSSEKDAPRRFIFRRYEADKLPRYYVVSEQTPTAPGTAWQVQSKLYSPTLASGNHYRFDLRANPTVTHQRSGKKQRHDVVMQAKRQLLDQHGLSKWEELPDQVRPPMGQLTFKACSDWLLARAAQIGVEFIADSIQVDSYQQHREKRKSQDATLRFSSVDFSGELVVRDAALLTQALTQGIGHAKGFGCGLLLLRPVS
ncbi:MAG: hypothetical protein RL748_3724 [Pseudomonadota bacterium]|jgi:CRISPR system Cascade subunit CasE